MHKMESSDESGLADLLKRAADGDDAAMEEFWREYQPELERAVRVHLRDPVLRVLHETSDIVQTVIRRYIQHKDSSPIDSISGMRKYMATLIRNRLHNLREKHDNELQRTVLHAKTGQESSTLEERIRTAESIIEDARHYLSEEEHQILIASKVEELPAKDVGVLVGKSTDAVRQQIHRIIEKIRTHLEAGGV